MSRRVEFLGSRLALPLKTLLNTPTDLARLRRSTITFNHLHVRLQMNRTGQAHSAPEEPSRSSSAVAVTVQDLMKNEEVVQGGHHMHYSMLAEAIASLPPIPQNLSALALFHQLPILYQQHYHHMLQSRILPRLQESLRLQSTANFAEKPLQLQQPLVSHFFLIQSRLDVKNGILLFDFSLVYRVRINIFYCSCWCVKISKSSDYF